MDSNVAEWLNLIFRWIHVLAGVMWIGHLWFFNFVNGQVAKTYDADSKKKVVPELMPRALYWFRKGALFTWISGMILAGMIYYQGTELLRNDPDAGAISQGADAAISLGAIVAVFFVYDLIWKTF